jgi:transposase-like protein
MGRKEQAKRSAEEKWEILQEGLKSGNIAETCRKHGVAPNLWYRWRDEAEQGAKAALGGRSAAGGAEVLSLMVLGAAIFARYGRHLAGGWRRSYVITSSPWLRYI